MTAAIPSDALAQDFVAFAVVFRFLAVVGVGQVAAEPGELDRHRRGERDALVGGAEQHVEFEARGEQAARIKFGQPAELGAVVEQAGVEEIGREPARLGLEFAEAQHAGIDRELHEIERQRAAGCGRNRVNVHRQGILCCDSSP